MRDSYKIHLRMMVAQRSVVGFFDKNIKVQTVYRNALILSDILFI